MASDYRDRGKWDIDDDADDQRTRPSGGGGVGSSSIAYESGRKPVGRRRLITLAIVLFSVGDIAAVMWYASTQGQQSGGDAVVPLISADSTPTKQRPEQPGGMDVPNQDKLIYDRLNPGQAGKPPVERLLPPAEAPAARPEPPPQVAEARPESLLPNAPAASPSVPPAANKPLEPQTVAPRPVPAQVPNEPAKPAAPPQQAAPPQVAPAPQVASVPPASAGGGAGNVRIQLGSVRSRDGAQQEWARLQKANKDLLGALSVNVTQANLPSGTFFRIQTSPVGDQAAASDLCAKLKARNVGCFIVR